MDERLERYAELCVRVGANVQPGQELFVESDLAHTELARAIVRQGYRAGAAYVHVLYHDDHVRRAMIELGPDGALTHAPEWRKAWLESGDGNAFIGTTGDPEPELMADLDGDRVGRALMQELTEIGLRQLRDNSVNWCVVAAPNEGWARQVFGEPDLERLWDLVAFAMRLDEPDPVAAWREYSDLLQERAAMLNALRPDALRYRGPGTDLTVGLLPTSRWDGGGSETASGIPFIANMPTEEIFTAPDCRHADGTIRSTMPLVLRGQIIRGLRLTFESGRIVQVEAETGAELVRGQLAAVENADRLGELALVTGDSRVGQARTLFYDTLFDENATCHIAWGSGYPSSVEGEPGEGLNVANIHVDFMVGGPDLEVDALLADGTAVPVIREEAWMLSD
jgi:Leucyl aminopeptidase (aminopeptidase T)